MATKKEARSSVTGKFVNKEFAKENPGTTQVETFERGGMPPHKFRSFKKELHQLLKKYGLGK